MANADSSAFIRGSRSAGRAALVAACSPRGTDARGRRRGSLVPPVHHFHPPTARGFYRVPTGNPRRGRRRRCLSPGRRGFRNSRRLFRSAMADLGFSSSSAPCLNKNLNLPTSTALLKRAKQCRSYSTSSSKSGARAAAAKVFGAPRFHQPIHRSPPCSLEFEACPDHEYYELSRCAAQACLSVQLQVLLSGHKSPPCSLLLMQTMQVSEPWSSPQQKPAP